jgi:hypothetical protein
MKHIRRHNVLFFALPTGLIFAIACVTLGQQSESAKSTAALPVVPIFATALDSPEFAFDCVNDTGKPVDLVNLLQESSAVIDGKPYARATVKFVGNATLGPGQTYTFTLNPAEYMPGGEKKGYSKTLKRWRWSTSIGSGRHTFTLNFGGAEYGPIAFIWNGEVPWLYE